MNVSFAESAVSSTGGRRPASRRLAVAAWPVRPLQVLRATILCAALGVASIATLPETLLACPGVLAGEESTAPSPELVEQSIRTLVNRMEDQSLEELWKSVERLKKIGKDAVVVLLEEIERSGEKPRLACSQVLLHVGDIEAREKAIEVLVELVAKSRDTEIREASILTLAREGEPEETLELLTEIFERETDPRLTIVLGKALWEIDSVPEARSKLIDLLDSRDPAVVHSAALTLAEIDYFDARVRNVLRDLRREPTVEGRLAASLYRNDQLYRQLEKSFDSGAATLPGVDPEKMLEEKNRRIRELEVKIEDLQRSRPGGRRVDESVFAVIGEVLRLIEEHYVDPRLVDRRDLVVEAVKGMVRSLDRFSSFLDPDETKKFLTDMSGEYCGIGAQVGKPTDDDPLEILKPIYGGPAHRAGLITGDQILEVDGVPTTGRSAGEIVSRLKGPEGSELVLRVYRRGWPEPREYSLRRATIEVPSVLAEMLPEKIGLIKLSQFGERSYEEFEEAVLKLEEDGLEGLILDLRNNPGGYLPTALKIVDLFVGEDERPIVTQKGRGDDDEGERLSFATAAKRPDYPLVILVNERSASASEIVSGALKDFNRAVVVGQRTFGKGTVQTLFPLSPKSRDILDGESRLKLTVKYYFLPSGRSIHTLRDRDGKVIQEGGVEPHVKVEPRSYPGWLAEEVEDIRGSRIVANYVDRHFDRIRPLLREGDHGDSAAYPEFEELYSALDTRASRDVVRRIVRYHLRRRVEDMEGREFAGDFHDDPELQRGILEVLGKLGRDPNGNPQYAWLKKALEDAAK